MRMTRVVALSCLVAAAASCGKKKTDAAAAADTSDLTSDSAVEDAGAEVDAAIATASNSSDASESSALADQLNLAAANACPATNACVTNADNSATVTRTFATAPCAGSTTEVFSKVATTVVCGAGKMWVKKFTQYNSTYDGLVDNVTYNSKVEPVLKLDGTTTTRTVSGGETVTWSIPAPGATGGSFTRTANAITATPKTVTRADTGVATTVTAKNLAVQVSYDASHVHTKWVVTGEIDFGLIACTQSKVTHLLGTDGKRCRLPSSGSDTVAYTDKAGAIHSKVRTYGSDAVPALTPDADGCYLQWVRSIDGATAVAVPTKPIAAGEAFAGDADR